MVTERNRKRKWNSAAARRFLVLAGNPPTVDDALIRLADDLLEGSTSPPTDLEFIMARLNITSCIADEDMPIAGELRKNGQELQIAYSPFASVERRRFTIAHELAHALLERTGPRCPRQGRELERLCDLLAAELLLPRKCFLALAGEEPGLQKVFELARIFRASITATALRCTHLLGLSFFELANAQVAWSSGAGAVRLRRGVRLRNGPLADTVPEMQTNRHGDAIVFANLDGTARQWAIEWRHIAGGKRILSLLRPYTRKNTRTFCTDAVR